MFTNLLHSIEPLIAKYGALGVFLGSIVEEVIAPIPSTLVVFTAGVLLTNGLEGAEAMKTIALSVMLPASAGIALGSLFPYFLARIGEEVLINKFGRMLGIDWSVIHKAKAWMEKTKRDELLLLLARMIPILPSVAISVTCGLLRFPVGKFLGLSFIGSLPRTFFLGFLGWYGGLQYKAIADQISGVEKIVLVGVVLAAIVGIIIFLKRRKKSHSQI